MTNAGAFPVSLADVLAARDRIAGQVLVTPFLEARVLSQITGARVFVKFENLQFTASFKERGALNRLAQLSADEARRGVAAMSAGNHAQGVAFHARRLGVPALIIMPITTPLTKVEQTRAHGAEVLLHAGDLADCASEARRLADERGLTLIPPYDDPHVIAGQGTVALEMIEAQPGLDAFIVPVGGGGLISGMAIATRALAPGTKVYGVQAQTHAAMSADFTGAAVGAGGSTIAEGIAVKTPGALTAPIIRACVDGMFTVPEGAIEKAVALFINVEKTVAEGAGAAALACLLAHREAFEGKSVGIVLSGGNIDARLIASVLMRELVREQRLVTIRFALADQPGLLARVTAVMAQTGANVIEVQHRRTGLALAANEATVEITFESRGAEHARDVLDVLAREGFDAQIV
ncbi:MAG: putative threonine dehydratase [Hyphomicrobiales bacterium]|nr:putative threonine dehydratase [Hyphomicrobiales bacterium]